MLGCCGGWVIETETVMVAERMVKAYVAGPFTVGDTAAHVRHAIDVGNRLITAGFCVHVPHLSYHQDLREPRTYEAWMRQCFRHLEDCDVLFRIAGASRGSDMEMEHAAIHGIPIFHDLDELIRRHGRA